MEDREIYFTIDYFFSLCNKNLDKILSHVTQFARNSLIVTVGFIFLELIGELYKCEHEVLNYGDHVRYNIVDSIPREDTGGHNRNHPIYHEFVPHVYKMNILWITSPTTYALYVLREMHK